MKNIRFRTKMTIFALSAAFLMFAVWAISMYSTNQVKIGSAAYQNIDRSNSLLIDISPAQENLMESYLTALQYIDSTDDTEQSNLNKKFEQLEDAYENQHKYWEQNAPDDGELKEELLVTSYNAAKHFFSVYETQVAANARTHNTELVNSARQKLEEAYTVHEESIQKAITLAKKWQQNKLAQAEDMSSRSSALTFLILIIGLAAGCVLSFVISESVRRPLDYVTKISTRIADGDLSATVEKKYLTREETGRLCGATQRMLERLNGYIGYIQEITEVLGKMAEGDMRLRLERDYAGEFSGIRDALLKISASLNGMLSGIDDSAAQVQSGSAQVSSSAQALAHGAAEQAETIESLSESIADISQKISENAAHVRTVSECVEQAADGTQDSNRQMEKMLGAMKDISESSKKISSIIKVIDDIAFQTNILALNAAVEAARAGEAGKGFSVVADEVRSLASKSAAAAKQTGELIQKSVRSVEGGSEIALAAAQRLKEVTAQTDKAEEMIRRIDEASAKQAQSVAQIQQGVNQISAVVQNNSATAEENAAASEQLSRMAVMLRDDTGRFKLDEEFVSKADGWNTGSPDEEEPERIGSGEISAVPKLSTAGA